MPHVNNDAKWQVFISSPFLISLATLLVNDLYLKGAYSNWATGKISDFSGLFLVTMFAFALLPSHRRIIGFIIASAFVFWKSPLSDPVIRLIQSQGVSHFNRVVDYSDLVAVVMIPLAIVLSNNPVDMKMTSPMVRRALAIPVVILSLFAVMGTSFGILHEQYIIRKADNAPCPDPEEVIASIDKVATAHGFKRLGGYVGNLSKGEYRGDRIRMHYDVNEHGTAWFLVEGMPSGLFFKSFPEKKMTEIKRSLMDELGHRFKDMEFVIPLNE
jgi:hypothetical protein